MTVAAGVVVVVAVVSLFVSMGAGSSIGSSHSAGPTSEEITFSPVRVVSEGSSGDLNDEAPSCPIGVMCSDSLGFDAFCCCALGLLGIDPERPGC